MRSLDKFKRLLKTVFSIVTILNFCIIYGVVWIGYYNKFVLQIPFFRKGNWVIIALYGVLITFFLHTYGGFKIGHLKNGHLIYSQFMSIIFTNIFTYFQIAVIDKRFVNPAYVLVMTLIDIFTIIVSVIIFQKLYKNLFPPRKMLFITGERFDYLLENKVKLREDKYEIEKTVSYKIGFEKIISLLDMVDAAILGDMPSHERNELVKYCYLVGKRVYCVPKIADILLRSSEELNLFDTPLLLSRNEGLSLEQQFAKRIEDIIISLVLIVVFSPIFVLIGIGIKCTDRGNVLYTQERLTIGGKKFEIYKFRTMVMDAENLSGPVLASEHDTRITKIGKILRLTRLDELPQLLNILKGEMSVVGPRPERPILFEEITRSIPEFPYRLKVKAGLTGYAQIYGKYNTTPYDKLKLDLTYIRSYSFLLDLKLIIMTPKIMLMKESTEGVKEDE